IGGSFPIVAGTVTAGPYTGGDNVTLSIVHSDSDCDFVLGSFQTGCTLPGAVCGNPLVVGALPYLTTDNTSNYGNDYENADVPSLAGDRKSTRLNSSHVKISYAVFCLKKKKIYISKNKREK